MTDDEPRWWFDDAEDAPLIPVYEFLISVGFSDADASRVALQVLLNTMLADLDTIRLGAAACGLAIPETSITFALGPVYRDKN